MLEVTDPKIYAGTYFNHPRPISQITVVKMLTDRIKDLIARARIVSFAGWEATHPSAAIKIFQAAEQARVYLTDADYQQLAELAPQAASLISVSKLLRDRVDEIVAEARAEVYDRFPDIAAPGGSLYPTERAEACWRDFWHYLRVISYGIAGGYPQYTSPDGLASMRSLYQELAVPLDAMAVGLTGLKSASLRRIDPSQHAIVSPYFDHLIDRLQEFKSD